MLWGCVESGAVALNLCSAHSPFAATTTVQGVLGTVIVNSAGVPVRTTLDVSAAKTCCTQRHFSCRINKLLSIRSGSLACSQEALTKQYAELIPSLADLARNLVRDLDPQVRQRDEFEGCDKF